MAIFASLTYRQSLTWQSERTVWEQAAKESPDMPRPHLNLALEYLKTNRLADAEREYAIAVDRSGTDYRDAKHQRMSRVAAESGIAAVWLVEGRYRESLKLSDKVLAEWPALPRGLVNRGTAELALGMCQAAIQDYRQAGVLELPTC